MPEISVTTNDSAKLVRRGLQNLDKKIPEVGRLQIYRVFQHIKSRMGKEGPRPSYPINWDSERQRKAFFASDGFGRGIPARRTGLYAHAWQIERLDNGYRLTNAAESYAKYVGGDAFGTSQSGIHRGRWPLFRDVVDEEIVNLPEEVEKNLEQASRDAMPF